MKKPVGTPLKGLPTDPILALRATELLARGQQLHEAGKIAEAARVSAELTHVAPNLAEAHELMGALAMRTGAADIAALSLERALALKPRSADIHVALAQALLALKRPQDASDLLNRGRAIHPNDAGIFRELGQAQLDLGDANAALKSFSRAAKLRPTDLYSRHMVAALSDTGQANAAYVTELFDSYAETFDEHLTGKLEYRVPEALANLVSNHNPSGPTLDVGCGTGLVATVLPEALKPIDGIDIAPKMVEKARQRGLYRHLHAGDATTTLAAQPDFAGPYGLIVSTDVFIYVGDIAGLFATLVERLQPQGLLAFSIETHAGSGIAIRSTGRFAHAPSYILDLVAAHGLTVLAQAEHSIRLEREIPIPGMLFVLQRSA